MNAPYRVAVVPFFFLKFCVVFLFSISFLVFLFHRAAMNNRKATNKKKHTNTVRRFKIPFKLELAHNGAVKLGKTQ